MIMSGCYKAFTKCSDTFFIMLEYLLKRLENKRLLSDISEDFDDLAEQELIKFILVIKKMRHTEYIKDIINFLLEERKSRNPQIINTSDGGYIIINNFEKEYHDKDARKNFIMNKIIRELL